MTAAAVLPPTIADRDADLRARSLADDRARDLAIVAAAHAQDRALAGQVWDEYTGRPDLAPEPAWVAAYQGPTATWRTEVQRREQRAREEAAAIERAAEAARHRAWVTSRIELGDVDGAAVLQLTQGRMPWRRATYGERVLAVEHCRTRGMSIGETADRMRLRPRAVSRMRRHARILRDGPEPHRDEL